jgi:uncharacterized protein
MTQGELLPFVRRLNPQPINPANYVDMTHYDGVLTPLAMADIHITDIEAAINHWRIQSPAHDGVTLARETRSLAEVYALMVYFHRMEIDPATLPRPAYDAWMVWYRTTPDTPCIAICSTSQGDAVCKGCGRTFDEVQHWPELGAADKRHIWRRITQDGTAWRFNRYAERALEGTHSV